MSRERLDYQTNKNNNDIDIMRNRSHSGNYDQYQKYHHPQSSSQSSQLQQQQQSSSQNSQSNNNNNSNTKSTTYTDDKYGQLGLGHKYTGKDYFVPKICSYNLVIKQISCGEEHTAFITIRGHIYTIGSNNKGRLGIDNKQITQSSSPCLVEYLQKYICSKIACGANHTVAIMENGHAYSWGNSDLGVLGNPSITDHAWGPVRVEGEQERYSDVSCGARHTMLMNRYGEVFGCGSNDEGQLGIPQSKGESIPKKVIIHRAIEAICGYYYTLILTQSGEIYSSGANNFGQLGIGHKSSTKEFIKVQNLEDQTIMKISAGHHSAALNRKGELFIWGTGLFGEFMLPTKFSKIDSPFTDLAVGGFFGGAVDSNGVVWSWGSNKHGELGVGDDQPRLNPFPVAALKGRKVIKVACGTNYMVALSAPKTKDISNKSSNKNKHQTSINQNNNNSNNSNNNNNNGNKNNNYIHNTSIGVNLDDDNSNNYNNRRKETLQHHVESTFTDLSLSNNNMMSQDPNKYSRVDSRMGRQNHSLDNYDNSNKNNIQKPITSNNLNDPSYQQKTFNSHHNLSQQQQQQQQQQNNHPHQDKYQSHNNSYFDDNHSDLNKYQQKKDNNQDYNSRNNRSSSSPQYNSNQQYQTLNQSQVNNNINHEDDEKYLTSTFNHHVDDSLNSNNNNNINKNNNVKEDNNTINNNIDTSKQQSNYQSEYSTINPPPPPQSNINWQQNSQHQNSRDSQNYYKPPQLSSSLINSSNRQINLIHIPNNTSNANNNMKYSIPPLSKSPSLHGHDSFLHYDTSKRVSTENNGQRRNAYDQQNISNRLKQRSLSNVQSNQEKELQEIEHNILLNKYNYLEETLNNERKEKSSMETSLFELRSQLKEIQYGKGGLNDLTILLNEEIQKFEQLKRNHDELYKRNHENENRIIDLTNQIQFLNSIKEDQDKSISFAKEDIKQKNQQLQNFTQQIIKLEQVYTEKQILVDNLQFAKEEIKTKDKELENYKSQITKEIHNVLEEKQEYENKLLYAEQDIQEKNQQLSICASQIQQLEEIISEKQELLDKMNENMERQVEKYQNEQQRTNEIVKSLNQQCNDFKDSYGFLEDRLSSYQENLTIIENAKNELEKKVVILQQEIKEKENETFNEIQSKQKFEQYYYAELKTNEEINLENKSLKEQLQCFRIKFQAAQDHEKNLENQINELQSDNLALQSQIPQIDLLHRELRNKEEYIEELECKSNALKAQVKEIEEKNIQLGQLLNAEVDRQAEQYKQNTLKNLYSNAESLYHIFNSNDYPNTNNNNNNIKNQANPNQTNNNNTNQNSINNNSNNTLKNTINKNMSQLYKKENEIEEDNEDFDGNHIIENQIFDSVENSTVKQKPQQQQQQQSLNSSQLYTHKPARVLQNNAQDSLVASMNKNHSQINGNIHDSSYLQQPSPLLENNSFIMNINNNRSDIVRTQLKNKIEDQKRKISSSAKKLLDILDNSHDNINNNNLSYSQIANENGITKSNEDKDRKQIQLQNNNKSSHEYNKYNKKYSQNQNQQQQLDYSSNHTPNQSNNASLSYSPIRSKIKSHELNQNPSILHQMNNKSNIEQDQKMKDLTDVKERLAYMKRTKDELESKIHDMDAKLNKYSDIPKK